MNYTFHQLKVFVAIASHHSITRAAEELHLTQPAVSLQLKTLQDQFEIPLTEIIGRRLYVTDFGRSVAQAAERILQEASMLEYQAKAYKGLLTGKLRISVASTGKYVMPVYLSGFMAANPGIDLEMDVTNKTKVLQSIKDNEVDFSLISVLPDDMLLEQEELLKNPLFLTGAPGRDFFPDKVLDKSVFTDLPLIFREQGSATRAVMQRYFSKIHIVPKARFELTSNEAVKQAVMGGLGYSIISLLSIKHELMQQAISIINVRDLPLMENWRLVWHPQRKMSIVAGAFIDYIRINKAEIFRVHFKWIEKYILPHPET